jgi:hypothetical protein
MQITKRKFLRTAPDIVTVVAQVAALPPADFEEVLQARGRLSLGGYRNKSVTVISDRMSDLGIKVQCKHPSSPVMPISGIETASNTVVGTPIPVGTTPA